jgi:hypothetical protein
VAATPSSAFPITADPSATWWTKNIATCAAQIAAILAPGKVAEVVAKLAKTAKKSKAAKAVKDTVEDMGGLSQALKQMAKYADGKGKGLSKTNKARVEALFAYGGSVAAEVLGLGGCYTIAKEVMG